MAAPETCGSLGMNWNAERSDERMPGREDGKLRQVERRGLLQVGDGVFNRFALRRGASLRIEGNVAALFGGRENRCQFHGLTPARKARLSLIPSACGTPRCPDGQAAGQQPGSAAGARGGGTAEASARPNVEVNRRAEGTSELNRRLGAGAKGAVALERCGVAGDYGRGLAGKQALCARAAPR